MVLKGLLNTGDADAYEAAITERQFLAEVQHPLILEIYNFASFDGAGYIVMEYVGGRSLKQILKERMAQNNGAYSPFPADQAIAYVIEILPAFSYLHAQGLLYCDFKPDNVIQAGDSIKLIDLGGVRRADDDQSAIYGTVGYQAPEVAEVGPSVPSEIFTIGRTLAVLAMEFRGYQSTYLASLPPVDDIPLFQRYDSFYRVLAKATAPAPDDRFQSADELRDQLLGVLREVVAVDSGAPAAAHSSASSLFGSPTGTGAQAHLGRAPGPAGRPRRCLGDVARRRVTRRRCPATRRARAGAGTDGRGPAGQGPGRDRRGVVPRRGPGRERHPHRQSVGVARGVALGPRGVRPVRLRGCRDRVQHRARPGSRRARTEARARAGLRGDGRGGSRRAALRGVCRDRRELRRARRRSVSPGPGSAGAT